MNVENAPKTNEKLIETQVSKHGVFTLVKTEKGVIIVIRDQMVSSKTFINYESAEKYISSKPYELILVSSYIYNTTVERLQNEQKNYNTRNGNKAEN